MTRSQSIQERAKGPTVENSVLEQIERELRSRPNVALRTPHAYQQKVIDSKAKRKIIRAGRRGGKTVGAGLIAADALIKGRRVLYGAPTDEQLSAFWFEVVTAFEPLIKLGVYRKSEGEHIIERPGMRERIRGKTCWSADTLRGDYADLLILDEWQLMDEDAWDRVGSPMLLDNNGDAIFIYTPPSLNSKSVTKARDARHASKMFSEAQQDNTGRWEAFHWSSRENPFISSEALDTIAGDMTALSYRQEVLAEDVDEAPGALWTLATLERNRVVRHPDLSRVGVGVDPPGGVTECGIVAAGIGKCACNGVEENHGFVLSDRSLKASPQVWGTEVVTCYQANNADRIYAEKNFGGDMVESTIRNVDRTVPYQPVQASRGKAIRAEPIAALYEQRKIHHVGQLPGLEAEMISWVPGVSEWSPNRIDALVWVLTELTRYLNQGSSSGIGVGVSRPITAGLMNEVI